MGKYFHSLNSFALRATGSEKRIDLQLIAMIKDAQAYLESETHVQFEDKGITISLSSIGSFLLPRIGCIYPTIRGCIRLTPTYEYGSWKTTS